MDLLNGKAKAIMAIMVLLAYFAELGTTVQFIFGDSLVDVGNNNRLPKSIAQAALPWYGIDFGDGMPNGRFSNGRTVADILGDKLGYPRPPAFLDPSVDENVILQNGLSYASGGAGILNDTGSYFVQLFPLYKQIELFQGTQALIRKKIGSQAADEFFREANYVVSMGSNDFFNNYLVPLKENSWTYSATDFINLLATTLQEQLKLLYTLQARKLTVFGLGPLGCIPLQRIMSSSGACQESTNQLALGFNKAVSQLIQGLSSDLPNATFTYQDAYDVVDDLIADPQKYGLNNSDSPCCTLGRIRPTLTCTPLSTLCDDRSKYVFWDEYHPTDRANEVIANALFSKMGSLADNTTNNP